MVYRNLIMFYNKHYNIYLHSPGQNNLENIHIRIPAVHFSSDFRIAHGLHCPQGSLHDWGYLKHPSCILFFIVMYKPVRATSLHVSEKITIILYLLFCIRDELVQQFTSGIVLCRKLFEL